MFGLIHSSLRRETRPLVRTLMLVLGVLAMPSTGQAALNGSHCARHDASAMPMGHAGTMHQMAAAQQAAAWQNTPPHTCPHCPASECARIAPCAGAASCVIAVTAPDAIVLSADRIRIHPIDGLAHSVLRQPPTPPPLLVS